MNTQRLTQSIVASTARRVLRPALAIATTCLSLAGYAATYYAAIVAALVLLPGRATAQIFVKPTIKPAPAGQLIVVNNAPGADHTDPHVSGDLVAYSFSTGAASTIHYFNLTTVADAAVPNDGTTFDFLSDVRGSVIAFTRVSAMKSAIFTFDTVTGNLTEVAPQPGAIRRSAQIGDQTIAGQDHSLTSGAANIVAYDRPSGVTAQVTTSSSVNQTPAVSPDGKVIVWVQCPTIADPCLTWKAVLSSGAWTAQQLNTQVGGNQSHPDTDGSLIAYSADFGTGDQLIWQPVGGGPEHVLNLPGGQASTPSISGGLISFAYLAPGTNEHQLAVYDIAANSLYQMTSPAGDTQLTDISTTPDGKVRVVWQSQGNEEDLYAYTFSLPVADLAIQKFGFPGTVQVGRDIAYGLVVHNAGSNAASDVMVTDPLPANTVLVGARPTQGSCTGPVGQTGTVTCDLGNLANQAYAVIGILVRVTGGGGTTITNTATVGSSIIDPNPVNNSASVATAIAP